MQDMQEMWVRPLGQEDPMEEEMATHSSILAWEIPCSEEPGRLQSMGLQRVGFNWAHTYARTAILSYFEKSYPRDNKASVFFLNDTVLCLGIKWLSIHQ